MKYTKFALLALLGLFTGCEEYFAEKDSEPDGSKPYISVMSPANNSVFARNQNIEIESLLSDKDNIKELEVQIVKLNSESSFSTTTIDTTTSGNKAVWSFKKYPTQNPVIIDTTVAASVLTAGNYLLVFNGIDGRTNVGTKEIKFTVNEVTGN